MPELPPIVTFWHGPMSWLERLSLVSYRDHGHPVAVYAYDKPEALPDGIEWRDAEAVLPRSELVFYKGKGTPAVFSDRFRVRLMRMGAGIWSDCDVYCLAPLEGLSETILSYERAPSLFEPKGSINGAVMRLPANSPLLDDLDAVFSGRRDRLLEPHLPFFRRVEVAVRRLLGEQVAPEDMQYGATCPFALTYFVPKRGLLDQVLPPEIFYPVPYRDIAKLLEPGQRLDDLVSARSHGLHIWRSQLTNRGRADISTPPDGSILFDLCKAHGIRCD